MRYLLVTERTVTVKTAESVFNVIFIPAPIKSVPETKQPSISAADMESVPLTVLAVSLTVVVSVPSLFTVTISAGFGGLTAFTVPIKVNILNGKIHAPISKTVLKKGRRNVVKPHRQQYAPASNAIHD